MEFSAQNVQDEDDEPAFSAGGAFAEALEQQDPGSKDKEKLPKGGIGSSNPLSVSTKDLQIASGDLFGKPKS
jgi:hypothetical protein